MRHHVITAAIGFLAAAVLVPFASTEAAAADPTGIWRKADQGERPGKMEVFRCGSGKRYICAKIVWLENPLDSRGKPLQDVRNENPSQRGRPILGLPIINGMAPVAANQWKGNIYNPEDGNTYSATLTLLSHNQIKLKGCKAWLLCGERTWLRTSLPKPAPEPQIEASAEPDAAVESASATAAAEAKEQETALSEADILTPAADHDTRPGYRFLNASTQHTTDAGLSGENVPSMFVMTAPIDDDAAKDDPVTAAANAPANVAAAPPAPKPAPTSVAQPKPQTMQAAATGPRAVPSASASAPRAAPLPADDAQAGDIAAAETETAETAELDEPMTRRQRRMLRRQQNQTPGMLPWLR
jgi:uncharacterized protein (DUF2147 family)